MIQHDLQGEAGNTLPTYKKVVSEVITRVQQQRQQEHDALKSESFNCTSCYPSSQVLKVFLDCTVMCDSNGPDSQQILNRLKDTSSGLSTNRDSD